MSGQLGARSKTKTRGMCVEEKEEWKVRQAATLARMDDLDIERYFPYREDFKGAWILERTAEMVSLKLRYKFVNSPDAREPEVSLQLFQPDCHGIERPEGQRRQKVNFSFYEKPMKTPFSSLISGIDHLAVTIEEDPMPDDVPEGQDDLEDGNQEEKLSEDAGNIIPAGAEGPEYDSNISYLFNDSLNLFHASAVNESQIVTILTDDLVNMSTQDAGNIVAPMEEIPEGQLLVNPAIPDGMPDEDVLRIEFNLDLNRFMFTDVMSVKC